MRVIAGKYKGRRLFIPKGIRPTKDNVKESLFNILSSDIQGASVLDLFAGSGALGIEALSRGAKEVVFVDNSKASADTIERNIAKIAPDNEKTSIRVIIKDAFAGIRLLRAENKKFDIIILDPPYNKLTYKNAGNKSPAGFGKARIRKCLKYINVYDILPHSGLVIVEHFKKDILPAEAESLALYRELKYSDTILSIYRKQTKDDQNSHISGKL